MRVRHAALVVVVALLASCSGGTSAASPASPRTVVVSATDGMEFIPGEFEFAAGETVRFEITNDGELRHEFFIGDEAAQQEHAAEMADMPGMEDEPSGVTLEPGESETLEYTFDEPGRLFAACHEPGHYEAGMIAQLTVR